jgi:hypothetical protein
MILQKKSITRNDTTKKSITRNDTKKKKKKYK